jgi:hypothetical protein
MIGSIDIDRCCDRDLASRDPQVPALALALDPGALTEVVRRGELDLPPGSVTVRRLRYKPATALHAAVSVGDGETLTWLLLAGYSPPAVDKLRKDLETARTADGVHVLGPASGRWLVVAATTDRMIVDRRRRQPASAAGFRPIAYNPRRRLVALGSWRGTPVAVAKRYARGARRPSPGLVDALHARGGPVARPLAVDDPSISMSEWVPGHPAAPATDADAVSAALRTLHGSSLSITARSFDVPRLTDRTAHTLGSVATLLPNLKSEVRRASEQVRRSLSRADLGPVGLIHGDLSPDQVVIAPDGATFIDLDDCVFGPTAWDSATWLAAQLAVGAHPHPLPGPDPPPELLGAAIAIRTAEPFQRRRRGWASITTTMIDWVLAARRQP